MLRQQSRIHPTCLMSDPRVFFASERTPLAWIRTGLTIMGLGFVVGRFGLFLGFLAAQRMPSMAPDASSLHLSTGVGMALVLLGNASMIFASIQPRRFVLSSHRGRMSTRPVVVGIDVGGERKGFHAVALSGGRYSQKFASHSAQDVASWCKDNGARLIGVDAPCRWSSTDRARPAERQLASEGVFAFATPTRATAEKRTFYRWMLNGAELFKVIERDYLLFDGQMTTTSRVCFETFPQAVACALAGKTVSANHKGAVRRDLLRKTGIETTPLTNIDIVDAALCAVAAQHLLEGTFRAYGDATQGIIVVPAHAMGA